MPDPVHTKMRRRTNHALECGRRQFIRYVCQNTPERRIFGYTLVGRAFERHNLRWVAERMHLTPVIPEASLRRTKLDSREVL